MSDKVKFPAADAKKVAKELCNALRDSCLRGPHTHYLKVCGSLRRRKREVGDIEIVYVSAVKMVPADPDLLGYQEEMPVSAVDAVLDSLLQGGILTRRISATFNEAWGPKNKLALHTPSGIPVDFFATTPEAWAGYTFCRTGPATTNVRIATAAKSKGWKWHPYDGYFTDYFNRQIHIDTEEDVFRLVGLPYLEPHERI